MDAPVCYSHIGKRLNHEDNFLISGKYITPSVQRHMADGELLVVKGDASSKIQLFAISDGMGGHQAGEVASYICVKYLAEVEKKIQNCVSLKDAVKILQLTIAQINDHVCQESVDNKALRDMGATLVVFLVFGTEYAVLNIGDSRAYYFDGELTQLTIDNTEGQRMVDLGILTKKEVLNFSARKNLNRYIGFSQRDFVLKADEYWMNIILF